MYSKLYRILLWNCFLKNKQEWNSTNGREETLLLKFICIFSLPHYLPRVWYLNSGLLGFQQQSFFISMSTELLCSKWHLAQTAPDSCQSHAQHYYSIEWKIWKNKVSCMINTRNSRFRKCRKLPIRCELHSMHNKDVRYHRPRLP